MNYENVKFANEAKENLIKGVNLITDAIACTYGPNGKQVAIQTPIGVKLTKDGATVAQAVNDSNPYITMGIDLIREISKKTAEEVGDGSSTVAILAREIVNKYKDCEKPINTSRLLQAEGQSIINELEKLKKEVTTKDDLLKVASLSANNDISIGSIIADAFDSVGSEGLVTFEESDETTDRVEFTKGFRVENGYSSPYFINTAKGTCELENVYVHLSDTKMDEVKEVIDLAEKAMKLKKSLLLIAPGFNSEIYIFLKANLDILKSCTVISPNYRSYRYTMMSDIKDILGETQTCNKVICDSKYTTFIGYNSDEQAVNDKVKIIRDKLELEALNSFDKEFEKKRLANFVSGIATIYVGGYSKTEINSKMDLYEDAVNATHQAIINGILPGGGVALYNMKDKACYLKDIIEIPSKLLETTDKSLEDMINLGIIEPFNVVKTTLENAISIAGQIISCDCAIIKTYNV